MKVEKVQPPPPPPPPSPPAEYVITLSEEQAQHLRSVLGAVIGIPGPEVSCVSFLWDHLSRALGNYETIFKSVALVRRGN